MHGKLLAYNHIMMGSANDTHIIVGMFLCEIDVLGWPHDITSGFDAHFKHDHMRSHTFIQVMMLNCFLF